MPKKLQATPEQPAGVEATSAEVHATSAPEAAVLTGDGVESVDILDARNEFVRQYSRQVHGDQFSELADSFIAGHPSCHKV
jgi:hypothetical protein